MGFTAQLFTFTFTFSLKAQHDGFGNRCPVTSGYVMDGQAGVGNNVTANKRIWEFSTCSQDYFDGFITYLNRYCAYRL